MFMYPDLAFGGRCPFPERTGLVFSDDKGEIPWHQGPTDTLDNNMTFQGIFFERPCEGNLGWSYTIYPRILPEGYRSSPYYDFRAEPLGLTGTGMFSLILPKTGIDEKIHVLFSFDLSLMPEGSRGLWSYGEGRVEADLSQMDLMNSMYAVGKAQAIEEDGFGVYWFSEPPFDVRGIARRMLPIFRCERDFFEDPSAQFRVFLRRDPFEKSGGGSACPYAFISGYSAFGTGFDEERWFDVLIHELTHTWPSMVDRNTGEGTWFCEGATEYYCTLLPYWGGFRDAEATVRCINRKIIDGYLDNPYREMPNMDIARIEWQDLRAQTVPYGRGMLYLANTEAKLRKRGLGSILEIVRRYNIMDPMPVGAWEEFVFEKLGEEGLQDLNDMREGKIPVPEEDLFGPHIETVETTVTIDDAPVRSYEWRAR